MICLVVNLQMGTCSQFLPVKNKAAVNVLKQGFVCMDAFLGWVI